MSKSDLSNNTNNTDITSKPLSNFPLNITFDRKFLIKLVLPLVIEQILAVTVGMADMIMVSGAGETAVSGVSLVNTIATLLIYVFTALATGGAVVAAQAIGAKKKDMAVKVSNQLILICFASALVITTICLVLNRQLRPQNETRVTRPPVVRRKCVPASFGAVTSAHQVAVPVKPASP